MTRKFVVIKPFTDLEDNKHVYRGGQFYPREDVKFDEARAGALASDNNAQKEPLIVEVLTEGYVPIEEIDTADKQGDEDPENVEVTPEEAVEPEREDNEEFPKHTGGGYYELSNGEKVQGKEKAIEAEKALKE